MYVIRGIINDIQQQMQWSFHTESSEKEGVLLLFDVGKYQGFAEVLNRDDLTDIENAALREMFDHQHVSWICPNRKVWDIHLDQLKAYFAQQLPALAQIKWFSGLAQIEPTYSKQTIPHRYSPELAMPTKNISVYHETTYEVIRTASISIVPETVQLLSIFTEIVHDKKLAEVLSSRWRESIRTLKAEAYFSTVILLGSILEGILLNYIQQHAEDAKKTKSAPKDRSGNVISLSHWTFKNFIDVAHECGWIEKYSKDFSTNLREYRNFIHPAEQAHQRFYADEGVCNIARDVVLRVINSLMKNTNI